MELQAHFDKIEKEGKSISESPFPGEKRKQVEDNDTEIAGPPLQAQKVTSSVFQVGSGSHPPVVNTKKQSDVEVIECDLPAPTGTPRVLAQEDRLSYLPNPSGLLQELEVQRVAIEELAAAKQKATEDLFIALQKKKKEQEVFQKEIDFLRGEVARKSNEQAHEGKRRQSAVAEAAEAAAASATTEAGEVAAAAAHRGACCEAQGL